MKKIFYVFILISVNCFAAHVRLQGSQRKPLPAITRGLHLAPKKILEQRLSNKGFGDDLVKSQMIESILHSRRSAVSINMIVGQALSDFPHYKKRKRSIINCLLQEYPAIAEQLWEKIN